GLYAIGQGFFVIVRQNRYSCSGDDRTTIELLADEVNRAAMFGIARLNGAQMGVQALVTGQQRRMDVDQSAGVVTDKGRAENAHKAGQYHGVRLKTIELCDHRLIKRSPVRVVLLTQ